MSRSLILCIALFASSCDSQSPETLASPIAKVETSGKRQTALSDVPAPVLAAVREREPSLKLSSAESETRDSRRYFDIGGTLADGSEIEFDVMEEGGRWRVVETQRDIALSAAPEEVRAAARSHDAAFEPTRVIESRQEDGLIIYELYAPAGGKPQGRKVEIKWDGRQAAALAEEWAH